jgi:dienelactone hydrolase
MHAMLGFSVRVSAFTTAVIAVLAVAAFADDRRAEQAIQEEVWAIPVTLPTIAYVVRPLGKGPFPLVVMNHGVSLNQKERGFFPLVEFRDAAIWFAKRGYMVVAPTGSGYGAAALDVPEHGHYPLFFSKVGNCDNPNFHDAGRLVALMDKWIIDYMADQKLIVPDNVIVVGQSAGGWAAIALSSENVPGVRAIITFAAGRGGRVGGKPNNNCAPDRLVAATGEFGRTARTPMLWIYIENDTFFGPELSRQMHAAYTGAGGKAEYHLLPPFGDEGHFLVSSADSLPLWTPLVAAFLDKHR